MTNSHQHIDPFTKNLIRRKINQLVGRAGFSSDDRDDLEQKLIAHVLRSLPTFDPAKGHLKAFVTTVIERHVANILRDKRAAKRDHRRIGSLNVMIHVKGEGYIELAQTISQRELDAQRGTASRSDEELAQLVMDVAAVLATLPEHLRDLAERCKTQTISEISRDTGIPRTTLYEWIRAIRLRFESANLQDWR